MTGVDLGHVALGFLVLALAFLKLRDRRSEGLVASALALVAPLQSQLGDIRAEVDSLKRRVADLEFENAELWRWGRINYGRVADLGGEPEPIPLSSR